MGADEYSHTVPDPLGLSSVDLLSLQAAHVTSISLFIDFNNLQCMY